MRRRPRVMLALLLIAAPFGAGSPAVGESLGEAQVKAAFLYHFGNFVRWPAHAESARPFSIGVSGDEAVATELERHLRGKKLKGRDVVVVRLAQGEDVRSFDVLFVGEREDRHLATLLRQVRETPVLTVGETDLFDEQGGMIRLLSEGSRLRFRVNAPAVERAGLRVPSALLNLSR